MYRMLFENKQYIDVRSPQEFEEYSLPGAINIPIFDDEERALVGTAYKQQGKEKAMELGLEILSPKLPSMYRLMRDISEGEQEVEVYCWRGGMRSGSFVSFMNIMGISCSRLPGGIRSFRKEMEKTFQREKERKREYIVLSGGTGTGKTEILDQLEQEGYPVISLEDLANHRGSAFGSIGLKKRSQKQFELLLWIRVKELEDAPFFIIEGESRRIGNIHLPDFIQNGKWYGHRIDVQLPMKEREKVLLRTYDPKLYHEEIKYAIEKIESKLTDEAKESIHQAMQEESYDRVASLLLEHYYDPRYDHAYAQYEREPMLVAAADIGEAKTEVARFIESIQKEKV